MVSNGSMVGIRIEDHQFQLRFRDLQVAVTCWRSECSFDIGLRGIRKIRAVWSTKGGYLFNKLGCICRRSSIGFPSQFLVHIDMAGFRLPGNHKCCTGIQKGNPGSGWWIYLHPKNHRKTTMFWKISPHFRDIYDFFIDLRMTRYPLTRPQGRIAWCQCLSWSALKSLVVRHPKGYLTLLLLQWQNHAGIWWPVTTNSSLIKIMHLDEPRVATQLLAIALPRRITSTNFGYPAGSIILQLGIHIPMYIHWWQTKKKDPRSKPTIKIPDWSPRPGRDIKSIDRSTH